MTPLHNPANLAGISSAQTSFPLLPHVAVFDTAFFQTMPEHAYLYALPLELYQQHNIRRYVFMDQVITLWLTRQQTPLKESYQLVT